MTYTSLDYGVGYSPLRVEGLWPPFTTNLAFAIKNVGRVKHRNRIN